MLILQAKNVMRRFGADILFSKVNVQVDEHARLALVGRNGAGKTTLLKMIAGITEPDEGTISKNKGLSIGYLAQDQGLDSQNSIWAELDSVFAPLHKLEAEINRLEQQVADATTKKGPQLPELLKTYDQLQQRYKEAGGFEYQSRMRGILTGFGFPPEMDSLAINSLSGGQKTKLALAKILLQQPQLLILDEPTNHLDMNVLSWLEDYLKSYQGALLVVSHDRYFLDRVVNEIDDLDNGTIRHYRGNYSAYTKQKRQWLQTAMKHYQQQQAKIAKLEDYVNRNLVRASTTKQAQSRRRQLEKMDRLEKPTADTSSIHFHFHADHPSGNEVLDVDQLKIGYNEQVLAGPLSFSERKGQRIGIFGPNGIGKSTLLKTILHQLPPIAGTIKLGASLQIGYYDQEQQSLHLEKTVLDEIWDEHPEVPEAEIRSLLGSFLFVGDDVFKPVHDLSGGEKARLELTKLSFTPINFLLLDEPTNHLDIDSREVLETAINEFDGTVLFISHDRYFINQVATDVLDMSATGMTHYEGNYDDFLVQQAKQTQEDHGSDQQPATSSPVIGKKKAYQQSKQQQREHRKLQRQADGLEQQLTTLEGQQDKIKEEMAKPEHATDIAKLTDLQKQLDELNKQADDVEEQWTEAAMALEDFEDKH